MPASRRAGGKWLHSARGDKEKLLEFSFDFSENAVKGKLYMLVVTNPSADVTFVVEEDRAGTEKLVRVFTTPFYDERKGVEEAFRLIRSEGVGCEVDLSDEQLEMLFDADFARSTESARFTFTATDGENSDHTTEYCYFPFDPQQIIDVL